MKDIMKSKIFFFFVGLIAAGAATNVAINRFELPAAKVTVRVVDESGHPVKNADTWFYFMNSSIKGITDAEGLSTGEASCDIRGIGCTIKKDGYYMSGASIPRFTEHDEALDRWKPWNETYTTILRPIGKPVALYAKKIQTDVPVLNQPCGYDSEVCDWVMPYGKGMKKDFVFTVHKNVKDRQNFDAQGELTFANPLDGLQETSVPDVGKESMFKWERQAPENGYQPMFKLQYTWWESSHQKPVRSFKFDDREWEGYFFRVRTVEQDGKIVSAHYGKIRGGIEIEPRETKTCTIIFTYYFNPTSLDRNLEWDTKRDLFGGLSDMETPREP
jgi:hypothetical protein